MCLVAVFTKPYRIIYVTHNVNENVKIKAVYPHSIILGNIDSFAWKKATKEIIAI